MPLMLRRAQRQEQQQSRRHPQRPCDPAMAESAQGGFLAACAQRLRRRQVAGGTRGREAAEDGGQAAQHCEADDRQGACHERIGGAAEVAAAEVAARAIGSRPYEAADLAVHYLAQTRTGPARTSTTVLRHDERHALCQIRLVDAGNDDLLLAMATVTLVA